MIAYEDLVVALTNWRINQGLPTSADAFAAFESGSVDLALPVADPVELSTSEVLALDSEDEVEAEAVASHEAFETADSQGPHAEAQGFESYTEDEASLVAAPEEQTLYEDVPAESMDVASNVDENLDYGDEETAYGEMPEMDDSDELDAAPSPEEFLTEPSSDALGADEEAGESDEAIALEAAPIEDPQTEEVVALGPADEMASFDEVPAGEVAAEEHMDAGAMVVEEEVNADGLEVASEEEANEFEQDEVPTKFGAEDDRESTVLGIGIDELVPPDEG